MGLGRWRVMVPTLWGPIRGGRVGWARARERKSEKERWKNILARRKSE